MLDDSELMKKLREYSNWLSKRIEWYETAQYRNMWDENRIITYTSARDKLHRLFPSLDDEFSEEFSEEQA